MEERVPEIRFEGFEGPWAKRILKEIIREITRTDSSSDAPVMMISANYGFIEQADRYAFNNAGDSLNRYILLQRNELAYNHGASKIRPYGSCFALTTLDSARVPFVYHCFSTEVQNAEFLSIELNGHNVESQLRRIVCSSARMDGLLNISFEDYSSISVFLPSIEEQNLIAEYISRIDTIITLNQQKLDKLKTFKKSCLEKMFPKEGETMPEIRFQGFEGPWENKNLSELATMHARIGWQNLRTSEFMDNGDYMLITGTDFEDGQINYSTCHYVKQERYDQDKNIQVRNGSILVTKDGTLGKVAFVQGLSIPATLNAGVFNIIIKDDVLVSNNYLFQYLKAPFLMEFVNKKATGGTIKHLNQSLLVDFPVKIPSKKEQEKIGVYLNNLDRIIFLYKQKLDKLKSLKQACLEKMFV